MYKNIHIEILQNTHYDIDQCIPWYANNSEYDVLSDFK